MPKRPLDVAAGGPTAAVLAVPAAQRAGGGAAEEAEGRTVDAGIAMASIACAETGVCMAVPVACGGTSLTRGGTEGAVTGVLREFRAVGLKGMTRQFLGALGECTTAVATASLGRAMDGLTLLSVTALDATFPAAAGVTDAGVMPTSAPDLGLSHRPMINGTITHAAATTQ